MPWPLMETVHQSSQITEKIMSSDFIDNYFFQSVTCIYNFFSHQNITSIVHLQQSTHQGRNSSFLILKSVRLIRNIPQNVNICHFKQIAFESLVSPFNNNNIALPSLFLSLRRSDDNSLYISLSLLLTLWKYTRLKLSDCPSVPWAPNAECGSRWACRGTFFSLARNFWRVRDSELRITQETRVHSDFTGCTFIAAHRVFCRFSS